MFFVILIVTHPNSRDDGSPRFRRQTVKVELRTDAIVKCFRNFVAWAEPNPKTAFFRALGSLRLFYAQSTGNSFTPNQWYRWKAETPKVCLLLVWTVSDQAFGRYKLLKGAEKWSRDHHEN